MPLKPFSQQEPLDDGGVGEEGVGEGGVGDGGVGEGGVGDRFEA